MNIRYEELIIAYCHFSFISCFYAAGCLFGLLPKNGLNKYLHGAKMKNILTELDSRLEEISACQGINSIQ